MDPPAGGGGAAGLSLLQQAEIVWAIWPKRVGGLPALAAIQAAIQRDGLETVLAGTRKIVAADARRKVSPPGRYLPRPEEFFDASRYLDDPAHYGPREGAADPSELRKMLAEKRAVAAQHPGNPDSPVGSLERKKKARPDYDRLVVEIKELTQTLQNLTSDAD